MAADIRLSARLSRRRTIAGQLLRAKAVICRKCPGLYCGCRVFLGGQSMPPQHRFGAKPDWWVGTRGLLETRASSPRLISILCVGSGSGGCQGNVVSTSRGLSASNPDQPPHRVPETAPLTTTGGTRGVCRATG